MWKRGKERTVFVQVLYKSRATANDGYHTGSKTAGWCSMPMRFPLVRSRDTHAILVIILYKKGYITALLSESMF